MYIVAGYTEREIIVTNTTRIMPDPYSSGYKPFMLQSQRDAICTITNYGGYGWVPYILTSKPHKSLIKLADNAPMITTQTTINDALIIWFIGYSSYVDGSYGEGGMTISGDHYYPMIPGSCDGGEQYGGVCFTYVKHAGTTITAKAKSTLNGGIYQMGF